MTTTHHPNRLVAQLANLIALESAIERRLKELIPDLEGHAGAGALLAGFKTMTRGHRLALETRLATLSGSGSSSVETATHPGSHSPAGAAQYPVSSALQEIYTLYHQAVIGYAVLHALATRALDSSWIAEEGTAFHLARQHTRNYTHAIQQVARLFHDVVLWELDQEGSECECICPSCAGGICLCSMAGRLFLSKAWQEAGPIFADEGIYIQHPKQGSAAVQAGLVRGDVILAAEGDTIESLGDMQNAVRNSQPEGVIHLTVRRHSDELEEVTLIHHWK